MYSYHDQIPIAETVTTVGHILCHTPAGFPSPAQDLAVNRIDIGEILVKHPSATYYLCVQGHSMKEAGIEDGDHLIVDRSLTPRHNSIVIAEIDGEVTVKRLHKKNGLIRLKAANPTYPDIAPAPGQEWMIWGVVTHVIKDML